MMYYLKGLIARIIDIFDPDDVQYIVSNPKPEPLAPPSENTFDLEL